MEIIKLGTECKTKIGGYKGIITEVSIRPEGVVYNVSYEQDGIKNMYFYEFELEFENIEKNTIGFKVIH